MYYVREAVSVNDINALRMLADSAHWAARVARCQLDTNALDFVQSTNKRQTILLGVAKIIIRIFGLIGSD